MKYLLLILLLGPVLATGQVRNVVARYPISEPSDKNLDDRIIGRWKFEEDTNKNNFFEVIRRKPYAMDKYHIKFWDRGGTNPSLESNMHFSKVGKDTFINMPYFEDGFSHMGFFFLKILESNSDFTSFTAAVVGDTSLWDLDKSAVTQRIKKNAGNPGYYMSTVHLHKMKQ